MIPPALNGQAHAPQLGFRGYLSPLISIRFENVRIGEFRLLAFVGSTVAFGLMHERWLAACLAGAIYAMLMYRTKRLSDPIVAHMASNAAIAVWAIAAQQWSLLYGAPRSAPTGSPTSKCVSAPRGLPLMASCLHAANRVYCS